MIEKKVMEIVDRSKKFKLERRTLERQWSNSLAEKCSINRLEENLENLFSRTEAYDRQRENNVAVIVVFTMGHDEIYSKKKI